MLNSLIPAHIPEGVWFVDSLPRLPNSKIDRTRLPGLVKDQICARGEQDHCMPELDSFGQIRYVARKHTDARRALGNMTACALLKVVMCHWLLFWFDIGALPNSPAWLVTAIGNFATFEDVAALMGGVALIQGMGNEARFKLSMTEPIILAMYVTMVFILGPILIEGGGYLLTGDSVRTCHPRVGMCPSGTGQSYYLMLLFGARIIVSVWHGLTSRFSDGIKTMERSLQFFITAAALLFCRYAMQRNTDICWSHLNKSLNGFLCGGFHFHLNLEVILDTCGYIPLYMAFFYFGPSAVETMYSMSLHGPCMLGFLGLCFYLGLSMALIHWSIFPLYWASSMPILSAVSACITTLALLAFFMSLPSWIDFTLPGPVMLIAYMLNDTFLNCVIVLGLRIHGLQLLPSLPDLLWALGEAPQWLAYGAPSANPPSSLPMSVAVGLTQLVALLVPMVVYMWCMKWVYARAAAAGKVSYMWLCDSRLSWRACLLPEAHSWCNMNNKK